MAVSESAERLREVINKAIEDHVITPEEYEKIITVSTEDGVIDPHERALLSQLQEMIENGHIKFGKIDKK